MKVNIIEQIYSIYSTLSFCRNLKTRFLNPEQLFKVFNFLSNLLFSNSFFNTQTKQAVKQSKR